MRALLLLLFAVGNRVLADGGVEVHVHGRRVRGPLERFWRSTGFSPPSQAEAESYLLSRDVDANLALLSALPAGALVQVRVHWLLQLPAGSDPANLDFNLLDRFVHRLWRRRLRPGFELMGNPGGYFDDFEDPVQMLLWRDVVEDVGRRYIKKYGGDEVARWNFEAWNEPDHHDFGNLNMTLDAYLNYYDATAEGLRRASPNDSVSLKFGGPGGSCREPHFVEFCHGLLRHAKSGINRVTGERDVKLDFVSVHKKGEEGDWRTILNEEEEFGKMLSEDYPKLKEKPVFNDEADPEKSWWKERAWRGDVRYAAKVVSLILETIARKDEGRLQNLALISSDNAFLNDPSLPGGHFDQRTMTTRFQCEDGDSTSAFVVKPVYNAFAILALLGDDRLGAEVTAETDNVAVAALATKSEDGHFAVLLVNSDENQSQDVKIKMNGLPPASNDVQRPKFFFYSLTNETTNPRQMWESLGSPTCPSPSQLDHIRQASKLKRSAIADLNRSKFKMHLSPGGIKLLQICYPEMAEEPTQPFELELLPQPHGGGLIFWQYLGGVQCLAGFKVERARVPQGERYATVAATDGPLNFAFLGGDAGGGWWYRVRAVDVWGREGPYSAPAHLTFPQY